MWQQRGNRKGAFQAIVLPDSACSASHEGAHQFRGSIREKRANPGQEGQNCKIIRKKGLKPGRDDYKKRDTPERMSPNLYEMPDQVGHDYLVIIGMTRCHCRLDLMSLPA